MESLIYVGRSLLVLVVIIYLANWLLGHLNRLQQQNDTKGIKIMERHPVSKSSSLAIVEVMGVYYFMSCSDGGNTILEKLDETEVAALLERKRRHQAAGMADLSLQTLIRKGGKIKTHQEAASFFQKQETGRHVRSEQLCNSQTRQKKGTKNSQ